MEQLEDQLAYLRGMLREAIELKASAQRALQAEQSRYEALTRRVPWAVLRVSPEGTYADINPFFAGLLGRAPQEIIDQPVGTLGEPPSWVEAIGRDSDEETQDISMFVQGVERHYLILRFRNRADGYLSILALDQTERALALEEAQRQATRADAANRAKSEFLAVMSHEIRTPLNGVLGVASLMADTPLNPEQRELVDIIQSSGMCLLNLINDVLDVTKIEQGKVALENEPFSPIRVLEEVLVLFQAQASSKGIGLELNRGSQIPPLVVGDAHRLRQVVLNLVSNAIKFTSEGGVRVNLFAHLRELQWRLRIEVEDSGIGIPADKLDAIFEPFTQADSSTTRKFGGTGLGLNIISGLVELMGGTVSAESKVGEGSRFIVELEVEEAPPVEVPSKPKTLSIGDVRQSLSGRRILVVEDNAVNRKVALGFLERVNVEVICACHGQEALDILGQGARVDLIMMDMDMPVLDGVGATKAIREGRAGNPSIPIVALTANAIQDHRKLCIEAGMTDYLSKPIKTESLYETLIRYLG